MAESKIKVVVAGATGFIGTHLGEVLGDQFELIGLSRSNRTPPEGYLECRSVDLFSRADSVRALKGASIAVYLVHSMIPSARLVQAQFQDLDLLCADNFGRAAAANQVKHIIYVGGLIPQSESLSDHLRSRLEVEHALSAHGVPTITLRAGMVVGGHGSSFQMLARLVKRLPVMLCPEWTLTKMQPVALDDVIAVIAAVLTESPTRSKVYDLGAPEVITYRELMNKLAQIMKVRRRFIPVPFLSPSLSRLWVSLTTGAPAALARPLIKSLRHTMVARASSEHRHPAEPLTPVDMMLDQAWTQACSSPRHKPRAFQGAPNKDQGDRVVSVQRMKLPSAKSAEWVAQEYMRWLPQSFFGGGPIKIQLQSDQVKFYLWGWSKPLLELYLNHQVSNADRQVLLVKGGLLAKPGTTGRLEFRQVLDSNTLLIGLVDFEPTLPWWLYRMTQALAHRMVMARFSRHLKNIS